MRQPAAKTRPIWLDAAIASVFYFVSLMLWRESIPSGLGNDAAEEALRGILLLDERKLEPITLTIGNSAETLYLYLAGFMSKLLGPALLPIQLLSSLFALALIWLICYFVRRIDPNLPAWIPIGVATSSVWLFHYARSGLRAISSPVFLLSFALLIRLGEGEEKRKALWSFLAGLVLGLSIYAYTSCRILPIAALAYMAVRLVGQQERKQLLQTYAWLWAGFALASVPNVVLLFNSPGEFLWRGSYVLSGQGVSIPRNLVASLLLPLYYLDSYRGYSSAPFDVDGFSSALAAPGFNPIHPIVSIMIIIGLAKAWRLFGEKAEVVFLMCAWLVGTLILGIAGPSLTRFLILLPVYLIFASLAFAGTEISWKERTAPFAVAVLLLALVGGAYAYFFQFRSSSEAQSYYSAIATPLGLRARALAGEGKRVLCVVTKDKSVIRYLTYPVRQRVEVAEFYRRPFDPAEISGLASKADVLLVEKDAQFEWFRLRYAQSPEALNSALFDEFK